MTSGVLGGQRVEVVVKSSIPKELVAANVVASFQRDLLRFADLPNLGKGTGPVAIVGGGPSLLKELDNLKKFPGPIIAAGSVNDFLVKSGLSADYLAVCDPDKAMGAFFNEPSPVTTYLIASQCHQAVFDALKDCKVRLWHAEVIDMQTGKSIADFHGEPTISGGDSAILRAWPIAAVLGHRDFHFFGFDCSFPPDCESQHAYEYRWDKEAPMGVTVEHTGERFITSPGWVAQMNAFMRMLAMSAGQFTITIHGESLVASMCCKPRSV